MRAIKIDVIKKEIYEIDIQDTLQAMHEALDAQDYNGVRIGKTEMLWVDGEGLLRKPPLGAFMYHPYPNALPGHGLIIGLRGPENVDSRMSVEEIKEVVRFVDVSELPLPVLTMVHFNSVEEFDEYMKKNR